MVKFYNYQNTLEINQNKIQVNLDVNKDLVLKEIQIGTDEYSELYELVLNRELNEILADFQIDTELFLHPFEYIIRHSIKDYLGKLETDYVYKKYDHRELICRCFGVYQSEIEDCIESKGARSPKDITDKLLAGGGCTRCVQDIQSLISYLITEKQLSLKSKETPILDETQLIYRIDKELTKFQDMNQISRGTIVFEKYEPGKLFLKVNAKIEEIDLNEVEVYLTRETKVNFKVYFSF